MNHNASNPTPGRSIIAGTPTLLLRPQIRYTDGLPILERKNDILAALSKNQVIIIAGETGSGKTTQLPLICLEAGRGMAGKIGCTQPRRIAAVSIANRVAKELQCEIGREVGYKIRFGDHETPQTCIKFMTDGILLAEIERDPLLSKYDTLIIDEAHERSLNIDFILGYLRRLLPRRPGLKVIVSSATIDTSLFSKAFNNAPVIEVSGRMFPVEVLYLSEEGAAEDEEESYVDAAVKSVQDLLDLYTEGDLLVFMPTERDIRETCNRIRGLKRQHTIALPLFSRLSRHEQEAIFEPSPFRKIVVATNIAETSITVPNIKFVVDTGLARISRYAPRLRTSRLPIEPISKAAADQRMGRCGRVMDGVCIRLYSSKEFQTREPFTTPEIKRANLAGVILSMIAHRLGDIETFAFLEPPSRQAISEGYAILRELGALDRDNRLTALGKQMARLPLDPHIARMVIAARNERALREVKIIAAALSIADPRERPFEKREEADAMHARFRVPGSDFLGFLKLWDTYADEWNTLKTQNRMRKFCKEHYLSFSRMQEWHDVHGQIHESLAGMKGFEENRTPATMDAVHRSLITGLLSNCARRNEKGKYEASRGRELTIFPGSSLSGQKPEWLVCHQMLETSQLFAHTCTPIDPAWLEDLAGELCTRSYGDPWFDEDTGVVRATERVSLFGMQIAEHHNVAFANVNRERATEVFIREGLMEERLQSAHRFYTANKALRREIETLEAKLRTRSLFAGETALSEFYRTRLPGVGSVHDLNRLIKETGSEDFLRMTKEDLLTTGVADSADKFPDTVTIGDRSFEVSYAFEPGGDADGITMKIHAGDASFVSTTMLPYLVPALWPARIEEMIRALPKEQRKQLMPISECVSTITGLLQVSNVPFEQALTKIIRIRYGIIIDPAVMGNTALPPHLSLRIVVVDDEGNPVAASRETETLKRSLSIATVADSRWDSSLKEHERHDITAWDFGDLPETIEVASSTKGIPLFGHPALTDCGATIDLKIYPTPAEAMNAHRGGVARLLEMALAPEFAWIDRDLRFTKELKLLCTPFGGADDIRRILLNAIHTFLQTFNDDLPRTAGQFATIAANARKQATTLGTEAISLFETILRQFQDDVADIAKVKDGAAVAIKKELRADLDGYLNEFRCGVPFSRLRQYPRYLRAFKCRIARALNEPGKYRLNREVLQTYREKSAKLVTNREEPSRSRQIELYREMIEEFAISLFAQQEIKTLYAISEKRLSKKIAEIEGMPKIQAP